MTIRILHNSYGSSTRRIPVRPFYSDTIPINRFWAPHGEFDREVESVPVARVDTSESRGAAIRRAVATDSSDNSVSTISGASTSVYGNRRMCRLFKRFY